MKRSSFFSAVTLFSIMALLLGCQCPQCPANKPLAIATDGSAPPQHLLIECEDTKTEFRFSSPSDIHFTLDATTGNITIANAVKSLTIPKNCSRRWYAYKKDITNVTYFVDEPAALPADNVYSVPIVGLSCNLELYAATGPTNSLFYLIAKDDWRAGQGCDFYYSDIYTNAATFSDCIYVKTTENGGIFKFNFRHSSSSTYAGTSTCTLSSGFSTCHKQGGTCSDH